MSTIYSPPRAHRPWRLGDVLPPGATRYYSLGRWALVDALRACGVGRGDCVLVPGLICREVLASFNFVGAKAAFYQVTPGLCAVLDAEDLGEARAVLAVNYFGFPQDLDVFRAYCARTGASLIEDNAHGFLSRDADGELLGARGDAGVFSFRKTIPVPDGSALVLTGGRAMPEGPVAPPVTSSPVRYRLKQAGRRVAGRVGPVRTFRALGAVRQLQLLTRGHAVPSSAPDAETRIPAAPNPPAWLSRALTVAEPARESERRRALYELTGRLLEGSGGAPVFPRLPEHVVPYGFPVLASPQQAHGMTSALARHGLPLSRWPDLPEAIAPSAPEHYRHLWVVPFLW